MYAWTHKVLLDRLRISLNADVRELLCMSPPFELFNKWIMYQCSVPFDLVLQTWDGWIDPVIKDRYNADSIDTELHGLCVCNGKRVSSEKQLVACCYLLEQRLEMFIKPFQLDKNLVEKYFRAFEVILERKDKNLKDAILLFSNVRDSLASLIHPLLVSRIKLISSNFLVHVRNCVDNMRKTMNLHPVFSLNDAILVEETHESVKILFYNLDAQNLSLNQYTGLKKRFYLYSGNSDYFHVVLYSLLCRYQSCFSNDYGSFEGSGFHAAVPSTVLDYLCAELGVNMEFFASPFNNYFVPFCSAFYDTDAFFGSVGSCFDYFPQTGSFICNPPFTTHVIRRLITHLKTLLVSSQALLFFVIIPLWHEDSSIFDLCVQNEWCSMWRILKNGHHFHSGNAQVRTTLYKAVHNSLIFILQNQSSKMLLPIKTTHMDEIAMRFYK